MQERVVKGREGGKNSDRLIEREREGVRERERGCRSTINNTLHTHVPGIKIPILKVIGILSEKFPRCK